MIEQVVDIGRYPLAEPGSSGWNAAAARAGRELAGGGCSVLAGFIAPAARAELTAQCASLAPLAYHDVQAVNVYNTAVGAGLPADHPGRITMERGNAFVARDQIPAGFLLHQLYRSKRFRQFIACCFGLPELHELADPLAGLCLNVISPGRQHPWHFDTNEFTVSMLTQAPRAGGTFEYCPGIRSARSENFDDVRAVLGGRAGHLVRGLDLRPGDLQLFKGRYSLHRVTQVGGTTDRHCAIFAYSERPGLVGSAARTAQLFGRVLPQHLAAQPRRGRPDRLLD